MNNSKRPKISLALLIAHCALFILITTGCQQEVNKDMTTDDLKYSKTWGEPLEKLQAAEDIEVWHYIAYKIDHIVFLKNGKVIGQIRQGPQEKMWETVKQWVEYVKNNPIYQLSINEYLAQIVNQKLRLGMTQTEVTLSWGHPVKTARNNLKYGVREEWLYYRPIYHKTVLVFDNGILTDYETAKK
jgi:hypothetical protein